MTASSIFFFYCDAAPRVIPFSPHPLPSAPPPLRSLGQFPAGELRFLHAPVPHRQGLRVTELACRQERSEEPTSELQSQSNIVCRLLLEQKKMQTRSVAGYATHDKLLCSIGT